MWDQLLPVTDGFMVDLKALDPEVHQRLTGRGNELVLDSIRYLHERGRLAEVRLLLVPGLQRQRRPAARAPSDWLAALDPGLRTVVIGFRRHGVRDEYAGLPEAGPDVLVRARAALAGAGLRDVVTV